VVGDGEAETGPLEGSWKSVSFLNPVRDVAVLPILHLNGYKISGPNLDVPDFRDYAVPLEQPATERYESTRRLGELLRDTFTLNADTANFQLLCPDETNSDRLGAVFEVEDRCFVGKTIPIDDHVAPDGRVMEVLSEHLCEGWLEGYLLTGHHGLFATYEAFAMIPATMVVQHTKWVEEAIDLPWREPISSLSILLTSTCWRNDHNGFSHQGPGLIDVMLSKRGTVARIYLPPMPAPSSRLRTIACAAATTSTS
jgi:xylulose-5-phosphate/fructose-6-phosphate phosphoketolase